MKSFLFAEFAELLQFQTLDRVLFILPALVIQIMANCALHVYQMVLGHWIWNYELRIMNIELRFPWASGKSITITRSTFVMIVLALRSP